MKRVLYVDVAEVDDLRETLNVIMRQHSAILHHLGLKFISGDPEPWPKLVPDKRCKK